MAGLGRARRGKGQTKIRGRTDGTNSHQHQTGRANIPAAKRERDHPADSQRVGSARDHPPAYQDREEHVLVQAGMF